MIKKLLCGTFGGNAGRAKMYVFSVLLLAVALALPACGADSSAGGASAARENAPAGTDEPDSGYAYAEEDMDDTWDERTATSIALTGDGAAVTGEGARFTGNILTIDAAGTYVLSGELTDGQIRVDAGKEDLVRLVLNGVSVSNAAGAPLYAKKAAKTVLILADGTENLISDGTDYVFASGEDEPDAAIFADDSLTVNGSGALTVVGNCKDAVRAKDMLVVTGGDITVRVVSDGLQGRDGVAIREGNITAEAGNDGIKSSNDEDAEKGFVILDGGAYTLKTGHDGVQAETSLDINGGSFDVNAGGGAANAPTQQENFRGGGRRTAPPTAENTEIAEGAESTTEAEEATEVTESDSMKAFKAALSLTVRGGSFRIDAEDDAFHANADLTIMGGDFSVQTGDDAFHADGALRIDGGDFNIARCYEGLEGATVDIYGGDIRIAASDDAINAAGGSDASDGFGPMGGDRFNADRGYYVRIAGGAIDATASFDGIDANGDIYLEGGVVCISAQSRGADGAVDLDGSLIITGGKLITAGSVAAPSSESTQASLLVSHAVAHEKGGVITLKDDAGNTLLEYTSQISYTASAFSSPDLEVGKTYALFIDGEKLADIPLADTATAIADDGGAYATGGWGGGRGEGFPGGGAPPAEATRPEGGNTTRPEGGNPMFSEGGTPPEGGARPERGNPPEGGVWPERGSPPEGGTPPTGDGRVPPDGGEDAI
jgi:hypothetical protein